jgi:hypothetical protein
MLKSWSDRFIGNIRIQLEIAKEVVHRLEIARGRRWLTPYEEARRQHSKLKALRLSSLQSKIAKQESQLLWLQEGDAPTKFFHIYANAHRHKNHIRSLEHNGKTLVAEDQKVKAAFLFFDDILGPPPTRANTIKLEILDLPHLNLCSLDSRFTKEEVWNVIKSLLPDKAPWSDEFMTLFLHTTWEVIKRDIMRAFDAFWHLDTCNLHSINDSLMTLTPKSPEVVSLKDYRPISLIHSMGKLLSKVLANMLATRLVKLVHPSQIAFIKGRFIQDNSFFVQSSAKLLQARQVPSLLIKIDIA